MGPKERARGGDAVMTTCLFPKGRVRGGQVVMTPLLFLNERAMGGQAVKTSWLSQQSRIHRRFSCVLLGRGSKNSVNKTSSACLVITDCLHRSNNIIVPIWIVFVITDRWTHGPTGQQTDGPTDIAT